MYGRNNASNKWDLAGYTFVAVPSTACIIDWGKEKAIGFLSSKSFIKVTNPFPLYWPFTWGDLNIKVFLVRQTNAIRTTIKNEVERGKAERWLVRKKREKKCSPVVCPDKRDNTSRPLARWIMGDWGTRGGKSRGICHSTIILHLLRTSRRGHDWELLIWCPGIMLTTLYFRFFKKILNGRAREVGYSQRIGQSRVR